MNRSSFLRISNYLLFLLSCVMIGTGLTLELRFADSGPQRVIIAGLSRHDWSELHFIAALGFIVLSLLHLILNWSWVVKVATRQRSLLLLLSIGLGLLLIAAPLLLPAKPRSAGDGMGIMGSGKGPQTRAQRHRISDSTP